MPKNAGMTHVSNSRVGPGQQQNNVGAQYSTPRDAMAMRSSVIQEVTEAYGIQKDKNEAAVPLLMQRLAFEPPGNSTAKSLPTNIATGQINSFRRVCALEE